jgi:4'-phosphopantetheinyl transferase
MKSTMIRFLHPIWISCHRKRGKSSNGSTLKNTGNNIWLRGPWFGRHCPVTPAPHGDLRFSKNDYGRPETIFKESSSPLRFDLSHTDGLTAFAIMLKEDIGVDVEDMERREVSLERADRFFCKKEVSDLRRVEEKGKRERFYDYWTLKESFMQARGMGLSISLDQFSFHISDHEPLRISFDLKLTDAPNRWQFWLFKPTRCHRAALSVCSEREEGFQFSIKRGIPLQGEASFDCRIINWS